MVKHDSALTETDLKLHGSDLVLLLLAADTKIASARGRINGVTRLEKLLYLVERETTIPALVVSDPLEFKPYNYGPFSRDVYQGVETLESAELVVEERRANRGSEDALEDMDMIAAVEDSEEYVERCYKLTDKGEAVARLLAAQYPDVSRKLGEIKNRYAGRSLSSLIGYVYKTYPESAVNSRIRHRYL